METARTSSGIKDHGCLAGDESRIGVGPSVTQIRRIPIGKQTAQESKYFHTLSLIEHGFVGPASTAVVVVEVEPTTIGQNLLEVPAYLTESYTEFYA